MATRTEWHDWAEKMMAEPVPDYNPCHEAEMRARVKHVMETAAERAGWEACGAKPADKAPVIIGLDLAAPEPGPRDLAVSDAIAAVHDGRRQVLRFQQQMETKS